MEFEKIPGRAFLDTNLVDFILKHGEEIHDGAPCQPGTSPRILADVEALYNIFLTGQRASWQLAISPYTYHEILQTRNFEKKHYLQQWFLEIWYYWRMIISEASDLPSFLESENIRVELLSSGKLDPLPDFPDRVLLIDALVYNCDVFCTRDWQTILSKRDQLQHLPIQIVTPHEWWEMILPYAALWV
ncbi:MAG: hypothetical protein U9P14_03525 [Gemmatimonadota bacterium]|nr:hypothetical protein [Gemmatimonadota bacterium]